VSRGAVLTCIICSKASSVLERSVGGRHVGRRQQQSRGLGGALPVLDSGSPSRGVTSHVSVYILFLYQFIYHVYISVYISCLCIRCDVTQSSTRESSRLSRRLGRCPPSPRLGKSESRSLPYTCAAAKESSRRIMMAEESCSSVYVCSSAVK
jgi:hypothetical protein